MEEKREYWGKEPKIEFYIVPIDAQRLRILLAYTSNEGTMEFKSVYHKYTDKPIEIVDSYRENVTSVVYTICAFGYYKKI
ncbi:MAG: hypothetical protein R2741_00195 [Methanolobus sp.]